MKSLNDILWGDQLGKIDDENPGDSEDPGIMTQAMGANCLTMCCSMYRCGAKPNPPCASGWMGCA